MMITTTVMTVTSTTTMPALNGNGDDADVHGDFESSIHDYYDTKVVL